MKIENLLNHIYQRVWTRKSFVTTKGLGLVILVAAVAGAIAAVFAKRGIKRIILKTSTPKPSKVSNNSPPEFHETVCSAEFPDGCMGS